VDLVDPVAPLTKKSLTVRQAAVIREAPLGVLEERVVGVPVVVFSSILLEAPD
jgi:hypothetical protein